MKPIKTLVLVADDARARLFENHGIGKGLKEIEDFSASVVPEANNEYADRAGRNATGPGGAHHGVADLAEAERDNARAAFARTVLSETERKFTAAGFDRFVLVAAPAMLGVLRAGLPATLERALTVDLAKDFVKLPPEKVVERLADAIVL